jgi:hypothetical protein
LLLIHNRAANANPHRFREAEHYSRGQPLLPSIG